MSDLDSIWQDFDRASSICKKNYVSQDAKHKVIETCTNCFGDNIKFNGNDCVCHDCGLVLREDRLNTSSNFESPQVVTSVKTYASSNSKLSKMQEWYMWSNEEKNVYKLKLYVRNLCQKLNIIEYLVENIVDTVVMVMDSIKRNDGTKRARVKDGIIVSCIYYVSKDTQTPYSYMDMSKELDLDIKYVTRAERIILELINTKKLCLNKTVILDTKKPFQYVTETIKRNNFKVNNDVLKDVQTLIEIAEDNDILLDHTPLSIGVCCFYYILQLRNIDIDIKLFSDLYDLSVVTVIKTYNKLKAYDKQIQRML
jgi:transcription initiation factor TFIIIB Brf1 subunit/transcription initiation factor TFIIB